MLVALLLSLVVWSAPPPTLWVCGPGASPAKASGTSCEQIHFHVLGKFRVG